MSASATAVPHRPQYLRALERANEVRVARAELKRRVAFGDIAAADVLLTCPWQAPRRMAVGELLARASAVGLEPGPQAARPAADLRAKSVGSMTDRQRHALAALLAPTFAGSEPQD